MSRGHASSEAQQLIDYLDLSPHPEGGHYRETWRGAVDGTGRAIGTAILFLLKAGEKSHWHRVDATEIWFWHAGAPLQLSIGHANGDIDVLRLGANVLDNESVQGIVPIAAWQSAQTLGAYSLVSCTVSPGFEFSGFTLAPPDFSPTAQPHD